MSNEHNNLKTTSNKNTSENEFTCETENNRVSENNSENKNICENKKSMRLHPTVLKLGVVSFFADVASEMLYPITPIFLVTILGTSMSSLGVIEGLAEATASLLKIYSGAWSDLISKRKPFVVIGYFLSAVSKPFIGVSQVWWQVFFFRSWDRVGKGIRTAPRDALIANSVDDSRLGAAYGWHRAMDTLGAAVGPLIAILLMQIYSNDLRKIYLWALIPGLISVFFVLTVKENDKNKEAIKDRASQKTWQNPIKSWSIMNAAFKKYLFAWSLFSLVNSSDVFLIMKTKSAGNSTITVILLYCLYNLTYALSSPYLGKLSDKIERKKILIFGLLIFAFVYLGFSKAIYLWHFIILFLVYGFYMGATDGVGKALAVDLSPQELKGTTLGMLGTVTSFTTIGASVIAGFIWDHFGSTWTFVYGALGAFIASALLTKVKSTAKFS